MNPKDRAVDPHSNCRKVWKQEILAVANPETELERKVRELAETYVRSTEEYDLTVCKEKDEHGVARPTTSDEFNACATNARHKHRALQDHVISIGATANDFQKAIRRILFAPGYRKH